MLLSPLLAGLFSDVLRVSRPSCHVREQRLRRVGHCDEVLVAETALRSLSLVMDFNIGHRLAVSVHSNKACAHASLDETQTHLGRRAPPSHMRGLQVRTLPSSLLRTSWRDGF